MAAVSRETVPLVICSIVIIIMLATYVIKEPTLDVLSTNLQYAAAIIMTFAFPIGTITILYRHGTNITQGKAGWGQSLIILATMFLFIIVGFTFGEQSTYYMFLYQGIMIPVFWGGVGFIIFYLASAVFRGFRIRSWSSFVLAAVALVSLFGAAPLGEAIVPGISTYYAWIMEVPAAAMARGVAISVAIGGVGFTVRILMGKERALFGGRA